MSATGGQWSTGRPPDHGYYLGAWKHGGRWIVSELWFNPDAIGSGWFPQRGYFSEKVQGYPGDTVDVAAWVPMPVYEPAPVLRDMQGGY